MKVITKEIDVTGENAAAMTLWLLAWGQREHLKLGTGLGILVTDSHLV